MRDLVGAIDRACGIVPSPAVADEWQEVITDRHTAILGSAATVTRTFRRRDGSGGTIQVVDDCIGENARREAVHSVTIAVP